MSHEEYAEYAGCLSCGRNQHLGDPWDGECTSCEPEEEEQ